MAESKHAWICTINHKPLTHKTFIVIQIVVMTVLPFGCLAPTKDHTQPLITVSSDLQMTATPILENTATATALPTRKPTATFVPSSTPLPPQTDLPTIEPGVINSMIDSLYSRCKLPCWGSIIPGKTSQYAARRLLSPLGEWRTTSVAFDYNNTSTSINLTFEHGLVSSIYLYPALTRPYRINRLFTESGMPEGVRIEVIPYTAELTPWFNLILLYPSQGFFAVLSGEGIPINSIIHICPRNVSPDLYLFASNTYSLNEMYEIVSVVRPHIEFQTLDTITDMHISQFYEVFRSQSTTCMATTVKFQLP